MVDVDVDGAWLKLVSFFGFLFCTCVSFFFVLPVVIIPSLSLLYDSDLLL